VELEHLAPSRPGADVRAIARVTEVAGRRIVFVCEAYEGEALVGRATHRRAIVDRARFA
jgi:predicted thioesterase